MHELRCVPSAPRILVVQTRRLGDVLMATPLLRAIARGLAPSALDVLVEPGCAAALAGNAHVSALVAASSSRLALARLLRTRRYDLVVDAMGKSTSALLAHASGAAVRVGFDDARFSWAYTLRAPRDEVGEYSALEKLRLAAALGLEASDGRLDLPGRAEDRARADAWWAALGLGDAPAPVAFAPVSRRVEKRWPAERFAWLAGELASRTGRRLVVFNGPGEAPQVQAVLERTARRDALVVPGEVLPFASLPAAMARCAAYVGNDNGLRHVAVGLGLPTLAVFGPPSPANWTPPDAPHHLTAGGRRAIESVTIDEVTPLVERFVDLL